MVMMECEWSDRSVVEGAQDAIETRIGSGQEALSLVWPSLLIFVFHVTRCCQYDSKRYVPVMLSHVSGMGLLQSLLL